MAHPAPRRLAARRLESAGLHLLRLRVRVRVRVTVTVTVTVRVPPSRPSPRMPRSYAYPDPYPDRYASP